MNLKSEFALEVFQQMAFISALIGGFAISFVGVMLPLTQKKQILTWIIIVTITAAAGLIVCTLGWTLSASDTYQLASENLELSPFFKELHQKLSLTFITSLLLFLVGLGLSGWIRSKILGMLSSLIAIIAIFSVLVILSKFVS